MILFIDTSDFHNLRLALIDKRVRERTQAVAYNENYRTAGLIESFLKKNKAPFDDINKVIVCSGPGSFTGIRVGIALAQAFGFARRIPVIAIKKTSLPQDLLKLNDLKGSKHLTLHYGAKPNITKNKKPRR
jgi:tRNA threonylcarbamoyl adenosine modification protein YeaZ